MFFGPSTDLTPAAFQTKLQQEGGVVIDCRTAGETAEGMWPGAKQLDWLSGAFQQQADQLDPNQNYYLYCRSGARSGAATSFLKGKGFKNVFNLGGYGNIARLK
jgi:rhodanese-related sulfurtransferase